MIWSRAILAALLTLTLVFAPVVNVAIAKSCTMTSQMIEDGASKCPCASMSDCKSMPQCRTAVGCANHCYVSSAILTNIVGPSTLAHDVVPSRHSLHLLSLLIGPPTPPPRA